MTKKRQMVGYWYNTKEVVPQNMKKLHMMLVLKLQNLILYLITGGLGGVMTAASHGAKDANGLD